MTLASKAEGLGTANAKLILLGEHFVVPFSDSQGVQHPGSSALAIPLPELRTEVALQLSDRISASFESSISGIHSEPELLALMERALRSAARRFSWDLEKTPLSIASNSNFATSRGLGSSASFSVALTRAFVALSHTQVDIRMEAQELENLFHGKSSGLDTAVIADAKPIRYRNGKILSNFKPIAVDFVVADSGPRDSSSSLVAKTMEFRRNQPDRWSSLSREIDSLVTECQTALEKSTGARDVARTIDRSHKILSEIGLVNDQLKSLLSLGEKLGALAGKMSGAGSGGVAFFVVPKGEGTHLANQLLEAGAKVVTLA